MWLDELATAAIFSVVQNELCRKPLIRKEWCAANSIANDHAIILKLCRNMRLIRTQILETKMKKLHIAYSRLTGSIL
jgi:hypothetical protein